VPQVPLHHKLRALIGPDRRAPVLRLNPIDGSITKNTFNGDSAA